MPMLVACIRPCNNMAHNACPLTTPNQTRLVRLNLAWFCWVPGQALCAMSLLWWVTVHCKHAPCIASMLLSSLTSTYFNDLNALRSGAQVVAKPGILHKLCGPPHEPPPPFFAPLSQPACNMVF